MDVEKDALWLVEYIPAKDSYRISRFAEPDKAIAYSDNYEDAQWDIVANYGNVVKIILIRKWDGSVDYMTYNLV